MPSIEISDIERDAIAEVMNISMGNAATAASELLNAKVWITTPRVNVIKASEMHNDSLEPAVCVKIVYVKGIAGTNLMVLRQDDVQLILNQLMGQPLVVTPDFEFDELNISAVAEVMNQMMGSSATALSSFLGVHIDISTPTPYIMEEVNLSDIQDYEPDDEVAAVTFDLTIEGVIKSEFVSVMSLDLAQAIASKMLSQSGADVPAVEVKQEAASTPEAAPAPAASSQGGFLSNQGETGIGRMPSDPPANMMTNQAAPQPQYQQQMPQPMYDPNAMQPMMQPQVPYGMAPQMQQPYGYYQQNPYGFGYAPNMQPINIHSAQLHPFEDGDPELSGDQKDNLKLLMGVPLQISVEIGTARRKVKDILEFTQGTIIELERQAGAPVDVVVNGNLIARGDVVVIDDNFAVRITEMIKSKFMDSLGKE